MSKDSSLKILRNFVQNICYIAIKHYKFVAKVIKIEI